jgi:adenosylcobinamide-phosphate synthase
MSFFAILVALLLEQARPLASGNMVHAGVRGWMRWIIRNLDAGREPHGWLAWFFAVAFPTLLALAIHWLLWSLLGWWAAVLWSVVVLYVSLGFRQFSHHFTDIRDALDAGDEEQARKLLAQWRQTDVSELPRREIVRQVIEQSVLSAHRHVFGVLAWFSILAAFGLGPAGAVLYRLTEFAARYWPHVSQRQGRPVSEAARAAASQAWHWIDWLPARITALGFAVVGSFEDAIDSWRSHEAQLDASNDGVILAATAGAVNVRLGVQAPVVGLEDEVDAPSTTRQEPELAHLRSIVGLVWRSVVMWMLLLALLTLARLLG